MPGDHQYNVESRVPGSGRFRFIEIQGRATSARTVTLTKKGILTAWNKPEDLFLAAIRVEGDTDAAPIYVSRLFEREPDFVATRVDFALDELLARVEHQV